MSTVADAIVHALQRHNVTEVFGQSLPSAFFLAAERAGIRQISYRTENAGGAMADGYSRVSNRIGLVAAQNGPAATLLVPPLTEAMLVSIPLLAIVQDVPTPTRDRNAFQELDHHTLFAGCSKWTHRITDPARVADYVDMAVTKATTGRPGPVVLLLPKDVLISSAIAPAVRRSQTLGFYPLDRVRPTSSQVEDAARLLAHAENPLVVAGGGIHRSGASDVLSLLQEAASLPVATTNMGKGAVDERHPLSLGVIGNVMGTGSPSRFHKPLIAEADVVLLIGNRTNENGTDSWKALPPEATYIHLDLDGTEIGRNYEAHRLVGDARASLEDLLQEIQGLDLAKRTAARTGLISRIAEARAQHREEFERLIDLDQPLIRPERVMREIEACMDDDTFVVADASYSTVWVANYIRTRRAGQRFVYPRGMAGLGWGLPLALGVKAARPESTVICVGGDGGFAHVWAELETSVRANLPVVMVLLNNSILGFQKHSELVQFAEYTSAINFESVDHAAIARACGAAGIVVRTPEEIAPALAEAVASGKPTLIEVFTDPEAYPPISAWEQHRETVLSRANLVTA